MSTERLPLHHVPACAVPNAGVQAHEVSGYGLLNLRGRGNDSAFGDQVFEATGVSLPQSPGTCESAQGACLHWLGPTEWLLVAPGGNLPALVGALRDQDIAVTDVTSGYTIIALSGAAVPDLLKKACHYDFSAPAQGVSIQTNFAMTSGLIWFPEAGTTHLLVRRSFADYVQRWIADAAAEYGYSFLSAPNRPVPSGAAA